MYSTNYTAKWTPWESPKSSMIKVGPTTKYIYVPVYDPANFNYYSQLFSYIITTPADQSSELFLQKKLRSS